MEQFYCYKKSESATVKATEEYRCLQRFTCNVFDKLVVIGAANTEEILESKTLLAEINSKIEKGDILSVGSLSDLGNSYVKIMHEMKSYNAKGIGVIVKDMNIFNKRNVYELDDISLILKLNEAMIDMLDAYLRRKEKQSHKFHETIRNKGIKLGRPKTTLPAGFEQLYCQWREKKINTQNIISILKISRTTLYRYMTLYEKQNNIDSNSKSNAQE